MSSVIAKVKYLAGSILACSCSRVTQCGVPKINTNWNCWNYDSKAILIVSFYVAFALKNY